MDQQCSLYGCQTSRDPEEQNHGHEMDPDLEKKVEVSDKQKARARLVVNGFTDPDLTTIRAEPPTLSKVGRNCLPQLAASYKMKLSMGDVILQGDMGESDRDI